MLSSSPTAVSAPVEPLPSPRIRSRVFGRERWHVPAILGNVRAAAALSTVLESERGVRRVVANELTGRVLIEFNPDELDEPVQGLLHRALEFGPMSVSEFSALRASKPSSLPLLTAIGSAELGCLFLKLLFIGVGCPAVGAAAAVIGLVAASVSRGTSNAVIPRSAPAEWIEPDESCGVGNDQNGAQIVQNCRDNRVNRAHGRKVEAD